MSENPSWAAEDDRGGRLNIAMVHVQHDLRALNSILL